MIPRKLLIATAITTYLFVTACSDMTAPTKLVPRGFPAAAILAPHAGPVSVMARINGGGTAEMQAPLAAGDSKFGMGVTLLSDGSATGSFDCVDQHGDLFGFAGNIFGQVTSWFIDADGFVTLNVIGKFLPIPGGHPVDVSFRVTIQQYGGSGVGHWTLAVPDGSGGWFTVCYEILTSGQIVYRPE